MVTFNRSGWPEEVDFSKVPGPDVDPSTLPFEELSAHMLTYPHLYSEGGDAPIVASEPTPMIMDEDALNALIDARIKERMSK